MLDSKWYLQPKKNYDVGQVKYPNNPYFTSHLTINQPWAKFNHSFKKVLQKKWTACIINQSSRNSVK